MKQVAIKCMGLFSSMGEMHSLGFDKIGLIITVLSLGRLHEIYKKLNDGKQYDNPLYFNVLRQGLRTLLKIKPDKDGLIFNS